MTAAEDRIAMETTLESLRSEIDRLDDQIVRLLADRTRVVQRIVGFKHDEDAVRGADRVRQVLDRIRARAESHGLDPTIAERTYRTLIDALTEMQLRQLKASGHVRADA
jgi:chorismate mutase